MNRQDVTTNLVRIRQARRAWTTAKAKFDSDVDAALLRLVHEAAANFMSAEEVSRYSGFTVRRVREVMRQAGLTGRGKRLLAKQAATTLAENAIVLGIEPKDMDLMSPLAYLPAGSELRKGAEANGVSNVAAEFPETPDPVERVSDYLRDNAYWWDSGADDDVPFDVTRRVAQDIVALVKGDD